MGDRIPVVEPSKPSKSRKYNATRLSESKSKKLKAEVKLALAEGGTVRAHGALSTLSERLLPARQRIPVFLAHSPNYSSWTDNAPAPPFPLQRVDYGDFGTSSDVRDAYHCFPSSDATRRNRSGGLLPPSPRTHSTTA